MPEKVYLSLKKSAQSHRRSINSEALACLERSLDLTRPSPESMLARIDEIRLNLHVSKLTDQLINSAKRTGRP
jgi:hypothetical protein